MPAGSRLQDALSRLPLGLAPFRVIRNVHPVITLWAGGVQDAESHLPLLPCLGPAGYRTFSPIYPPAMVSSV